MKIKGAFNIFNLEGALAVADAAAAAGHPAFLQTSASFVKAWGVSRLGAALRAVLGPRGSGLVTLHLDHCDDLDLIRACVASGWDSVMIDGSHLPLHENIRLTRSVTDIAAPAGVQVEGQIGYVGGPEDEHEGGAPPERVRPDDAVTFARESGVNLLAVGAGTSHGHYGPRGVKVDVDLLAGVHALLPEMPLVLHGGSGIPMDQVADAVARGGVRKINISTDLKDAWLRAAGEHLEGPDPHNTGKLSRSVIAAFRETIERRIRLFSQLRPQ